MNSTKKCILLFLALMLGSAGTVYADTPLYSDSLQDGLATLEQNNHEYELLLSFDSAPETEDSWIIFSASGSGCIISGCVGSGCLGSGCGASGCFGSACGGSGCIFSGCGGSGCGGSVCGGSGCMGSGCGGSVCGSSVCGGSACVGSICGGSACSGSVCGGSLCGVSGCGGSICAGSVCFGTACVGSLCGGSGCNLSLCNTTGCGASACDSGKCDGGCSLQVDPGYMLAGAQFHDDGHLSICANFTGSYDVVYLDSESAQRIVTTHLDAGIVSKINLANAKDVLQVIKA